MRLQTWCGSYIETRERPKSVWIHWALGWLRVIVRPWRWNQVRWTRYRNRHHLGTDWPTEEPDPREQPE